MPTEGDRRAAYLFGQKAETHGGSAEKPPDPRRRLGFGSRVDGGLQVVRRGLVGFRHTAPAARQSARAASSALRNRAMCSAARS